MKYSYVYSYFQLANSVKQGGVLSAQLFTLFIDKLLLDLKQSGYGCHIGDTFIGVLSYADDITLICPSLRGINGMLQICARFAETFSLTFNYSVANLAALGCVRFCFWLL